MKNYPLGHHAVKNHYGVGPLSGEIIQQTDATVKIAGETGPRKWRKIDLMAVVPPDKIDGIVEMLEAAETDYTAKLRQAKIQRQIAISNILKGYEA